MVASEAAVGAAVASEAGAGAVAALEAGAGAVAASAVEVEVLGEDAVAEVKKANRLALVSRFRDAACVMLGRGGY